MYTRVNLYYTILLFHRRTSYSYHVQHVPYSDYRVKQEIPIVSNNGSICQRIVYKRYGARLEFQQIGKIGE